jgi:hypothetical protein
MATKYASTFATTDSIYLRFNNPEVYPEEAAPDFTLRLTPYSNMYLCYKLGSTGTPESLRAEAGKEYVIPYTSAEADFVYLYGASYI